MSTRLLFIEGVVLLASACAQSYTAQQQQQEPPPAGITVTTAPSTAVVAPGGTQGFTTQVTGTTSTSVNWSVQEGASGGGVTDAGVYTAPATAGTFHVKATSVADSSKSDSSLVTVTVGVSVSTTTPNIDVCGTATFTATVVGSANQAVNWSVDEAGGGTVDKNGVYLAPSTPGTYHVRATSQADSTQQAFAPITVSQHILSVTVSPNPTSVSVNGQVTFTANVTNTCGTFAASQVFRTADLANR
ncbi:MAG TPA: hypothetical protein VLW85_15275 [Myxococcales bacterium]|nr:hypothetical protein [Myxococcales bacterium]